LANLSFKQRQVALAVRIVVKNYFTMIATTDDVIKSSTKMNPGFPRHSSLEQELSEIAIKQA